MATNSVNFEDLTPDFNLRIDDGDLAKFLTEVLQPVHDLMCEDAERWAAQIDVDTADENTVDAMLRDLGNPFEVAYSQPINRRRLLVRLLVSIYKGKGSPIGLRNVIRALTGLEIVQVVSPATIGAWDLGVDVIDDSPASPPPVDPDLTEFAYLGPSPGFVRYSFQIEVDRLLTDEEKEVITEIVRLVKPAHTHFLGFIEPSVAGVVDHWELDLSYIHEAGEPLIGDEVDLHGP